MIYELHEDDDAKGDISITDDALELRLAIQAKRLSISFNPIGSADSRQLNGIVGIVGNHSENLRDVSHSEKISETSLKIDMRSAHGGFLLTTQSI